MTVADELDRLKAAEASAAQRRRAAWDARRNEADVSVAAVAPFTEYRDGIVYKKREPDVEEQRRLTRELFERVERDGLVLEAGPGRGTLIARDPAIVTELDEASEALNAARRERSEFERKRADEIERDQKRAEMRDLRKALKGDDPDRVREALRA